MTSSIILTLLFIVVLLIAFPPYPDANEDGSKLVAKLPGAQLEPIEPFAAAFRLIFKHDRNFVRVSKGIRGAFRRLYVSWIYLRLVWIFYRKGKIAKADAAYVWLQAMVQIVTTVLALPESAICSVLWFLPHGFSYLAYRSHSNVVFRCEVALTINGAPECLFRIKDLL